MLDDEEGIGERQSYLSTPGRLCPQWLAEDAGTSFSVGSWSRPAQTTKKGSFWRDPTTPTARPLEYLPHMAKTRKRLLGLAERHNYHTCLFIFDIPPEICVQRDQQRRRLVGEQVITFHYGLLQSTINEAPGEGWNQIHILRDENLPIEIEIMPDPC